MARSPPHGGQSRLACGRPLKRSNGKNLMHKTTGTTLSQQHNTPECQKPIILLVPLQEPHKRPILSTQCCRQEERGSNSVPNAKREGRAKEDFLAHSPHSELLSFKTDPITGSSQSLKNMLTEAPNLTCRGEGEMTPPMQFCQSKPLPWGAVDLCLFSPFLGLRAELERQL